MLTYGWLAVVAQADPSCPAPQVVELPRQDAVGLAVQVNGAVDVVAGDGDTIRVEACGGTVKVARRAGALAITGRRPVDAVRVVVPAGIGAVTLHHQVGEARLSVPALVAVVAGEGPLDVVGATSLRVAWRRGDLGVDGVGGDLWVDHLTGSVRATGVRGDARVDQVSGEVTVETGGTLLVDGVARPDPQARLR